MKFTEEEKKQVVEMSELVHSTVREVEAIIHERLEKLEGHSRWLGKARILNTMFCAFYGLTMSKVSEKAPLI